MLMGRVECAAGVEEGSSGAAWKVQLELIRLRAAVRWRAGGRTGDRILEPPPSQSGRRLVGGVSVPRLMGGSAVVEVPRDGCGSINPATSGSPSCKGSRWVGGRAEDCYAARSIPAPPAMDPLATV
jgi:hypothetical protein